MNTELTLDILIWCIKLFNLMQCNSRLHYQEIERVIIIGNKNFALPLTILVNWQTAHNEFAYQMRLSQFESLIVNYHSDLHSIRVSHYPAEAWSK